MEIICTDANIKSMVGDLFNTIDKIYKFSQKSDIFASIPVFIIRNGIEQDLANALSYLSRKKIKPSKEESKMIHLDLRKIKGIPVVQALNMKEKKDIVVIVKVFITKNNETGFFFIRALDFLVADIFMFLIECGIDLGIPGILTKQDFNGEKKLAILKERIEEVIGCMNYKSQLTVKDTGIKFK